MKIGQIAQQSAWRSVYTRHPARRASGAFVRLLNLGKIVWPSEVAVLQLHLVSETTTWIAAVIAAVRGPVPLDSVAILLLRTQQSFEDAAMTDTNSPLDSLNHVACIVRNVSDAVQWYESHFRCELEFADATWALLRFANSSLALVTEGDHPAHIGFVTSAAMEAGPLKTHRDGTRSVYVADPSGNAIELLDPASV